MLQVVSRDEFLALVGVKPSTLYQRTFTGEAAFALGCHKPAHVGEYLVLDAVAMILASMLNRFCGLELKSAAEEVRTNWEAWLELVTKAERWGERHADDPRLFFAVAWLSLEPRRYRVFLGEAHKIAEALPAQTTPCFVSIALVLRHLRANAKRAKITLPQRLTIDQDDKPAYARWRGEIDLYREAAGARLARAKPARPSVRKRLLPT